VKKTGLADFRIGKDPELRDAVELQLDRRERSTIPPMTRRTRHRLQIAVLVILSLLFQQAALAAYLCPMERMPAETTAMTDDCAGMDMTQTPDNPALCQKHCNPDRLVAADAVKLTVPPLLLPALILTPVQVQPISHVAVHTDALIARSDPPPRLRFCSLLI